MDSVFLLIALLVAATAGGVFLRLKVPAGLLVGGILAVSLLSILTGNVVAPPYLTIILQILSGTLIGSSFAKQDLLDIKKLIVPAVLLVGGMLANNLIIGSLIAWLSPLDLLSSLMGCIPGGVTEIVIMADQLGADVPAVAVMQLSRLIFSLLFFPSLIKYLTRNDEPYTEHLDQRLGGQQTVRMGKRILYTMAVGTIAGLTGSFIPFIPVPAMLSSMLAVSAANMFVSKTHFPRAFRRIAQVAAAVLVGSKVSLETITSLVQMIVPVGIMLVGYLVIHTVIGLAVSRFTGLNRGVSLFCAIPAGASDIALVASEMNYQSPAIALFQMVRLISCITIFPIVIKLLVMLVR